MITPPEFMLHPMGNTLLNPDHLHVVVNHLPLIGLAAAIIPLLYALVRREVHTLRVGFLLCLLFGGSVALVMATGEGAEEDIEHGSRLGSLLDAPGRHWLHEHEEAAEAGSIIVYVTAGCGLLGLLAQWKYPKAALPLGAICLLLCVVSIVAMARVAQTGGQIRHPEFRSNPSAT